MQFLRAYSVLCTYGHGRWTYISMEEPGYFVRRCPHCGQGCVVRELSNSRRVKERG